MATSYDITRDMRPPLLPRCLLIYVPGHHASVTLYLGTHVSRSGNLSCYQTRQGPRLTRQTHGTACNRQRLPTRHDWRRYELFFASSPRQPIGIRCFGGLCLVSNGSRTNSAPPRASLCCAEDRSGRSGLGAVFRSGAFVR